MRTFLHVNQHNIKFNAKAGNKQRKPVLTVKDYRQNRKCNRAIIKDDDGNTVAELVYSPDKPLACGAKVWIETNLTVETS
tara:strand:+ start:5932 stop:6171 length:240 start_codon:yes stop_codon:yes gene_type:complete